MKSIETRFLAELADIHTAETRLAEILPEMAKAVTCKHLKEAILDHLEETKCHVSRLEEVFACYDLETNGESPDVAVGQRKEEVEIAEELKGSPVINANPIAAVRRIEHHETPTYSSVHEWLNCLDEGSSFPLSRSA